MASQEPPAIRATANRTTTIAAALMATGARPSSAGAPAGASPAPASPGGTPPSPPCWPPSTPPTTGAVDPAWELVGEPSDVWAADEAGPEVTTPEVADCEDVVVVWPRRNVGVVVTRGNVAVDDVSRGVVVGSAEVVAAGSLVVDDVNVGSGSSDVNGKDVGNSVVMDGSWAEALAAPHTTTRMSAARPPGGPGRTETNSLPWVLPVHWSYPLCPKFL